MPAPARTVEQQQLAAPGRAISAVSLSVERGAEDGPFEVMFRRDRCDMGGVVLNPQQWEGRRLGEQRGAVIRMQTEISS